MTETPQNAPDRLGAIELIQRALENLERGYFGSTRAYLIRAKASLISDLQPSPEAHEKTKKTV